MNTKINSLINKALQYKDEEQYTESNDIINNILLDFPEYPKNNGLKLVMAGNYYNLKEFQKSIYFAKEVLSQKKNSELSALILYLSFVTLNKHEKAFQTLFNYLEDNEANLFKDTLNELLEGLLNGYGTTYKESIIFYAKKNNISVPKILLTNNSNLI